MPGKKIISAAVLGLAFASVASAASAEDTGNPPDWCRNGAFALSQDNIKLARVGKKPALILEDSGQKKGCPQAGAKCALGGDAAKPGTEVLINAALPGYSCAYVPSQDGDGGWVSNSDITVEQPQPTVKPPITAWVGKWKYGDDTEIEIAIKGGKLAISGNDTSADGNEGDFETKASPKDNKIHVTDNAPCEVWMTLVGNYLVARDNQQCGGMNVSFTGVYTKAKK
jgi:hypothetical protein